ncbi:MAG TPA: ABC transporter permease [Chitinophagaceae bacterium]|nr:ABC transporter permease [Chitinophagaceae bacterium]
MSATSSIQRVAWRRLRRNKGAVFGLVIIALTLFIALFAYYLAPDSSPFANRMIVELGAQKPGFRQQFLLLKKENGPAPAGFFQRLFYGKPDTYQYIPIRSYKEYSDHIVVEKYIDEEVYDTIPISNSLLRSPASANFVTQRFLLGTDKYGRDILSRLLIGSRVSLSVGAIAVLISLSIGILLGAIAGYFRGRSDAVIMWLINVLWSIPTLLLVFAVTLILGKGFWQIFIAVGLTMWVSVARLVRAQILTVRKLEYVEAARVLGYSNVRIIVKHILPNISGPIIVVAASIFASAIVIEAGLSFLGVGVQPPMPSWGLMIKENYNFIITNNPMLALVPGVAIMLLVLAFNLLGNGLRDALNVR